MLLDIIIIKYNVPEVEVPCIKSVLEHTEGNYHLTIHDNYPEKENLGRLWNRLIKQSSGDYICLLNSDTIVTPKWSTKLLETFKKNKQVGCVGPSTDNCINQQKEQANEIFVNFGDKYPGWCLSGFCLIFPKRIWKRVGGFPKDFGFYAQEVNFIDKITFVGYSQIWRTDVFVHHEKGASIKKAQALGEIDEQKERQLGRDNYNKFRKKLYGN